MKNIYEIVTKQLIDYLKIRHLTVFKVDPVAAEWKVSYSFGFSNKSICNLEDLREKGNFFHRVIETGVPQWVNDVTETERDLAWLSEIERIYSLIAVPIGSDDRMWGVLIAFSQERFKFREEDAKIITLFGHQIGELLEFFTRFTQENTDELLIQILGTLELLNFRYGGKESIPGSEMEHEQEKLKNRVLSTISSMEPYCINRDIKQNPLENKPMKLSSGDELNIEEVITIQGKKDNPGKDKSVLIIDDEPLITELLTSILGRINIKCKVASYGQAGLELFDKEVFDLVITDLGMPDISGWDVSKAVKDRRPEVPVIIITGWGLDPDPNKMKDSQVDQIITKPFQIDQLEKIIKDLLEK
jgi:CheY-like chemotaxis protein